MAKPFEDIKSPAFHISEKWRPIYETLCRKGRQDNSFYIFTKYTQLYSMCVSIGYILDKEIELERPYSPFQLEQVDEIDEWLPLQSMAWDRQEQDLTLLADSKKVIQVCDRLAEAGMIYLIEEYFHEFMEDGVLISPAQKDIEINLTHILLILRNQELSL